VIFILQKPMLNALEDLVFFFRNARLDAPRVGRVSVEEQALWDGLHPEFCILTYFIYHLESRWRNSHVLVYHGPLLIHLLGVEPSTEILCEILCV